jgi:hypothetical protein
MRSAFRRGVGLSASARLRRDLAEALRVKAGSPAKGRAAGRRGRPLSLTLNSAEPVASAGGIRVSQSASLRVPPGVSEPAAPGWRIRPTALLACSLARASPDTRRPLSQTVADGCGMDLEPAAPRFPPAPVPWILAPTMKDHIRWGMIGCGAVAEEKSGPALSEAPPDRRTGQSGQSSPRLNSMASNGSARTAASRA